VALTTLKALIARGQHQRRRAEFKDCRLATVRDGYIVFKIPDLTRKV
jgi:hypothetical protein